MKLLGHSSPEMTLLYAELTQTDLQREFRAARSQPPTSPAASQNCNHDRERAKTPDLPSTLHALHVAQHVLRSFGARGPALTAINAACTGVAPAIEEQSHQSRLPGKRLNKQVLAFQAVKVSRHVQG